MSQYYYRRFCTESSSTLMMEIQEGVELCFPRLLNNSCKKPSFLWSEAAILNITLFISLITASLNLLIIISISHFRQLHTPTNILLLSLAVSDFLVGLLLMPLETLRKSTCWFLGEVICVLYNYLAVYIICASIGNIVLISVDRYVAICDPLHYPIRVSRAKVTLCVCFCWLWYAFYNILFLKDELIQPGRSNSCIGECVVFIGYIAVTVDLILNFIFPVTVIVVLYLRVFVVAVSQARLMRSNITAATFQLSVNLEKKEQRTKKSELKAARTLGILILAYLMCYCPYYCYTISEGNVNTDSSGPKFFFFFLFYFNSCLNPLIYALFYPWFRKAIKLILTLQILQPGSCEANVL